MGINVIRKINIAEKIIRRNININNFFKLY